ncbi:MAG: helix-turn-helix transcriptional regulator, partial [Candidatus Izimaplasma sp.]|nr:helix-turn-helix transcriptional regulator [Candidatus Izimaplasma bacterium]
MADINALEKHNLKVLGVIVRVHRVSMGYSLRDLAKLANISHTLISNFEKGKITPHKDTIVDIFKILNLNFYDDPKISVKFRELYKTAFKHILYHEYDEAFEAVKEIEKDKDIYENSAEVINFAIIQCLYYAVSNIYFKDFNGYLKKYEVVLDFFSPNQKQLYFFIRGLNFVNKEQFQDARFYFEKALEIGDVKLDVLIKDYYVIALSKSNMFVDSITHAREVIQEFESQTNYVRAMRLRTRIAYDYYRINKYEEAEKLYKQVLEYSKKYNVRVLENRCNCRLALLAILKNERNKVVEYINKVDQNYNRLYHYIKLDIASYNQDEKEFLKLYNEYMSFEWVKNSEKTTLFFECIYMRYDKEKMDKRKYESHLKRLISLGLTADDAEMIEVASNMLTKF